MQGPAPWPPTGPCRSPNFELYAGPREADWPSRFCVHIHTGAGLEKGKGRAASKGCNDAESGVQRGEQEQRQSSRLPELQLCFIT